MGVGFILKVGGSGRFTEWIAAFAAMTVKGLAILRPDHWIARRRSNATVPRSQPSIISRIFSPSTSSAKGLVRICMPGSRWPCPTTAFSA
jgi:hypothetical protein